MKLRLLTSAPKGARSELVVALAFDGTTPALAADLVAAVRAAKATGDLTTELRKTSLFRPDGGGAARLLFVGMGKAKELDTERLRRAAAIAQAQAEALGVERFQLRLNAEDLEKVAPDAAGRAIAEGLVLGAYRYEPPRKQKPKPRKGQLCDVIFVGRGHREFDAGFDLGRVCGEATAYARLLGDQPGNVVTPESLAQSARKLGGGSISVRILDEKDMTRLKMGALLGVGRGSERESRMILLDHRPAGAKKTVVVVGKGITFDTGGISIKPSAKMDEMRYDMCGGAAVLGLFHAIKNGALAGAKKLRIVGVVAAAENMPDGTAQKPGDVVTACDGTTIEVLNTDAEGRLVLADALAYAKRTYEPDAIVDLATLTGAVIVALGHECAGVMGTDAALTKALVEAGKVADEPMWELPLWPEHREQMKSRFADLQNINSPSDGNGTIAGAAFLSYFVEGTPWAHIDIAGTAWGGRSRDYFRSGATGSAVRMLVHWLRSKG